MALTYCVLASGSTGNALWVSGGGTQLLLDCGLPFRTLAARLAELGASATDLAAIVCTHGHGDHVGGVAVTARRSGAAIHGSRSTLSEVPFEPPETLLRPLGTRAEVRIGGLTVRTAPTPHDAPGSMCLTVTDGTSTLGLATDLGRSTPAVAAHLAGVDGLVLEFNHDLDMLRNGPYPPRLKARIESDLGHLSNDQGAALLARLCHEGLQHVTLAHLSEKNNRPALARAAAEAALSRAGLAPDLAVAEQHAVGRPVTLRPGRPRGQLSLF